MLGYKLKDIDEFPRLKELFQYYKIKTPKLIISTSKTLNARSIFLLKSYVQINQGLLEELKKEEIFAVILHEIGHTKTKLLSFILTLLSIIYATLLVTLIYLAITQITNPTTTIPTITALIATRITIPYIITKTSKKIEIKCDKYAVKILGPNKNWLKSAFKKIQQKANQTEKGKATIYYLLFHPYSTHPTFQKRIDTIKEQ